jgi:hypothetical protein
MQLYETFVGFSTHLGIFFLSVGNAELSNKMASYTTNQKVFVVKTIYSSCGSCLALENISC